MGVSKIGRKCLFTSRTGFCFGTETTYASFHDDGKRPFLHGMSSSRCQIPDQLKCLRVPLTSMLGCWLHRFLYTGSTLIVSCGLIQPTKQLKVVHGKAAGSGVKQCIGDKKASLMMLARPIRSIPSCRCCSDFKVSLCAVEATERPLNFFTSFHHSDGLHFFRSLAW